MSEEAESLHTYQTLTLTLRCATEDTRGEENEWHTRRTQFNPPQQAIPHRPRRRSSVRVVQVAHTPTSELFWIDISLASKLSSERGRCVVVLVVLLLGRCRRIRLGVSRRVPQSR
jgi:hypothetical protein